MTKVRILPKHAIVLLLLKKSETLRDVKLELEFEAIS